MHPDDADDLEFDEGNEEHLASHGISPHEVFEVWSESPVYAQNKKGLAATHLMFGDTYGGRALTIAVLVKTDARLLRPITGWESTAAELTRWRSAR